MYFVLIGVGVFILHVLFSEVMGLKGWVADTLLSLIGFVLCLPLHLFSVRYRNNPLRAPSSFVSSCFLLLTASFTFVFLGLTGILSEVIKSGSSVTSEEARRTVGVSIMAVMGSSALIYSIPAIFA